MLYIHIPYCHQKCTYCAFYSSPTRKSRERYVEAVCREIALRAGREKHALQSVYFGGGTPSLLRASEIEKIVRSIGEHYDLRQLREVTLEANPEDLTREYLEEIRSMGFFNRLSVGVQSFHDADLRMMNRNCRSAQTEEALENARAYGFENISVDLIYGLPGQSEEDWKDNLKQLTAVADKITHLSAYALSVETGTMLARQIESGRLTPADEETVMAQYELLQEWCRENGFAQYEISSYARPGKESFHNSRYWDRTPYVGVGAAAHSFDGGKRRWNVADIEAYTEGVLKGGCYHEEETLTPADEHNEYLMTALRTVRGIEKVKVRAEYREMLASEMARFVKSGLIVEDESSYRPTREGLVRADGIACELFV